MPEDKEKQTEHANEYDDGALDQFIEDNKEELIADFIDNNNSYWIEHCKQRFKEGNDTH